MSSTKHVASKLEQRAAKICFLIRKNLPSIEIYRRINNIYGESTIRVQYVRKWCRKFKSSCENIIHWWKLFKKIDFCRRQDTWKQSWQDHSARLEKEIIQYSVPNDYGIWYYSEYHNKKIEIWKNMCSLDTAYADCQTTCCARRHLQKESHWLSKRREFVSHLHSYRRFNQGARCHIPTSKQSLLTWNHKN